MALVQLKVRVTEADRAMIRDEAASRDMSMGRFLALAVREVRDKPVGDDRVAELEGAVEDMETRLRRLEDLASGPY